MITRTGAVASFMGATLAVASTVGLIRATVEPHVGSHGIEVASVRLTAAGYMIDFRYKVRDPGQASEVMKRGLSAEVIHERTGFKYRVPAPPKVGPMRQVSSAPKEGQSYFAFFANPGRRIQKGDQVTLILGPAKLEHLVVE